MARHHSEDFEEYEGDAVEVVKKLSVRKENGRSRKPRDEDERHGSSHHHRRSDADDGDRHAKHNQLVRRGKPEYPSDSEASDSDREDKKSRKKKIARRSKSKDSSESEDDRKHRKSKSKDKKGKGKSKKRQDSDDEDSDDEVIVTKTKKYEDVDISELPPMYLMSLRKIFGANNEKIAKWCHNGLIRLDISTGLFNADKLLKKQNDDDEIKEWADLAFPTGAHVTDLAPGLDEVTIHMIATVAERLAITVGTRDRLEGKRLLRLWGKRGVCMSG
ncbi:hypothetical protein G7Y79_00012g033170 [Physcia stellaris]|nr:hypothetical protein G7Y79_00012g033170 [Physcia stellaris]